MIEVARREAAEAGLSNATFAVGDATALDLPTASVDGAVASQFITSRSRFACAASNSGRLRAVSVLSLAAGVVMFGFGAFMVVARDRLVARSVRQRGRAEVPATAWASLGVVLAGAGAVQVALAFV